MSNMSTIETALQENHIAEGRQTERFISLVAHYMTTEAMPIDRAIDEVLPMFVEYCGDCLIPAKWNAKAVRWTCDRCGA